MTRIHIFNSITILSVGISIVALFNAYMRLPIPKAYVLYAICAICLYLIAVWIVNRNLSDSAKLVFGSLTLHIVPIALSIILLLSIPGLQSVPKGTINDFEKSFNDIQRIQLTAAKRNGIQPFEYRVEAKSECVEFSKDGKLSKLSSTDYYYVRELTHSLPFLVPEAEKLLVDIAQRFQEISETNSRIEITSVLRTKEDIRKLQRNNPNAISNSCHCYGTTFDISYASFRVDRLRLKSNKELRMALSEAIYNLRKDRRCYVKFETAQKCYHITVR